MVLPLMSSVKELLKQAREAISIKEFQQAKEKCALVIQKDPANYNAHVFLGLAEQNLNNFEASEAAYKTALELNSSHPLSLQGLVNLYESFDKTELYCNAIKNLRNLLLNQESCDTAKIIELTSKRIAIFEKNNLLLNLRDEYLYLVDESFASTSILSEGDLKSYWRKIIDIQKKLDEEHFITEFNARRTRLGAGPIETIKAALKQEIIKASMIESYFRQLLKYSHDTEDAKEFFTILKSRIAFKSYENKKIAMEELRGRIKEFIASNEITPDMFHFCLDSQVESLDVCIPFQFIRNHADIVIDTQLGGLISTILSLKDATYPDYNSVIFIIQNYLESYSEPIIWLKLVELQCYLKLKQFSIVSQLCSQIEIHLQKIELDFGEKMDSRIIHVKIIHCQASSHMDKSVLKENIFILQSITQSHPKLSIAWKVLADFYLRDKRFNEALQCCQTVLSTNPTDSEILLKTGEIYLTQNMFLECESIVLKAIELENSSDAHLLLGKCYWYWDESHRTDRAFAYDSLLSALKINKDNSEAFTYLGHYYRQVDHDVQRALKCYQKSFSLDSNEASAKNIVEIYLGRGDFLEAEKMLEIYTAQYPRSSWAWKKVGLIHAAKREYASSIIAFQSSLRLDPKDITAWESLAHSYSMEGKFVAATKTFDRVLELDPLSIFSFHELGKIKQKLGHYTESIDSFKKALNLKCNHLPTILALSSVLLLYAHQSYETGAFGRSTDALFDALDLLLEATKEIQSEKLQTIYKLLGDAFMKLYLMPSTLHIAKIEMLEQINFYLKAQPKHNVVETIFSTFNVPDTTDFKLERYLYLASDAFQLAITTAIKSGSPNDVIGSYWSDLSLCVYRIKKHITRTETPIQVSVKCITLAIYADPYRSTYWNSLGVYAAEHNVKLSQHAFIKSLELDSKSSSVWSNLGFLYLAQKDYQLAGKAFESAQFVDPEHPNSWFGQSILKKLRNDLSFTELVEQAYELNPGNIDEINYQYAIQKFNEVQSTKNVNDHSTSILCLLKYVAVHPSDAAAFNLLGVMYEAQEKFKHALESYQSALFVLQDNEFEHLSMVKQNIARCMCSNNQFEGSLEIFEELKSVSIWSTVVHGLAFLYTENLQNAFKCFEDALSTSLDSEDITLQNDICYVLSQALYALGHDEHIELAKQQLLSTITRDQSFTKGILSLCAIGLVRGDVELSRSAFNEISKFSSEQVESESHKVYYIQSIFALVNGDFKTAKVVLSKGIRAKPYLAKRWSLLFTHIIKFESNSGQLALVIAKNTNAMNSLNSIERIDFNSNLSLGLILSSKAVNALRNAQRDVLVNPFAAKSWMILCLILRSRLILLQSRNCPIEGLSKSLGVAIESLLRVASDELLEWAILLKTEYLFAYTKEKHFEELHALCERSTDENLSSCCYSLLAKMYLSNSDTNIAIELFKKAIEFNFNSHASWMNLATIYYHQEKYHDSITCIMESENTTQLCLPSLLFLAKIFYEMKNYAKVSETLSEIYEGGPCAAAKIIQALTILRGRDGNTGRANKLIQEVSELYPEDNWVAWAKFEVAKEM